MDMTSFLMGMAAGGGDGAALTLTTLPVTENGTYSAQGMGVVGWDLVEVNVPSPTLGTLFATRNETYTPDAGVDGWDRVEVNVPQPELDTLTATENGRYSAQDEGVVGWDVVNVDVPIEGHLHFYAAADLTSFDAVAVLNDIGGGTVNGMIRMTLTMGGNQVTEDVPVTAFASNGDLIITGGGSDGTMAAAILFTGSGTGLSAQQLYLIQGGTLTDLTSAAGQIISNITLMLIF